MCIIIFNPLTDEKMEGNNYMHTVVQLASVIHSFIQYLLSITTMEPGTVLGSGDLAMSKTRTYFLRRTLPSGREIDNKQINMEAYAQSVDNKDYVEQ